MATDQHDDVPDREGKKILFVTDAWTPQVNGVVRVLQALIPIVKARGYEIELIEPGQFITVPLPFYPEIRFALFPYRRVLRTLKRRKDDAVCIVTEWSLGWTAHTICRLKGIPFTSWYHTHFQLYVNARLRGFLGPIHKLMRQFHKTARAVMVSTPTLRDELSAKGFRHLELMPLGVDLDMFVRNPHPPHPPLPGPVFVYFSRLATEKSPEDFLKLDLPGTKLVIGDGPLRKKLEKRYARPDTIFVGYKHGQELVDWLSLADVMVFPSKTETFGLVALEAMACGLPVAAYDLMGPRDVITSGVDGYVGDDLRENALACLELSREACRRKAEQYSWERSADALIHNLFPKQP